MPSSRRKRSAHVLELRYRGEIEGRCSQLDAAQSGCEPRGDEQRLAGGGTRAAQGIGRFEIETPVLAHRAADLIDDGVTAAGKIEPGDTLEPQVVAVRRRESAAALDHLE